MTASAAARTISRHYNAPPLNYIQAPSMIISRINSTNTIAALDPVPHPQLPIIHSSFFSIHNILWKNKKSVLYFINNKKSVLFQAHCLFEWWGRGDLNPHGISPNGF